MSAVLLPLFGALLVGALAGCAALLRHLNAEGKMRGRLRFLSGAVAAHEVSKLPSIQVPRSTQGAGLLRFLGFLRYQADLPKAQIIPWPVVLVVAVAVGFVSSMLTTHYLDLLLGTLASVALAVQAARLIFGWQTNKYCKALFEQIPEALGLMVRAIRAGLPMAEALRSISREMPVPTKDEFARVVGDMAIGRPVDQALMRLYERTGLTEYSFLAVTLGLQAQTGGSLAETLDNLGDMVRKRVALAKRASALAGEAKVQAGMLLVMPFLAAAGLSFIQPFYISAFMENPTGQTLLVVAFCLMAMGVLTIRWMIGQASKD